MKEEEARKKQCPIMNGCRPIETCCLASTCMMWKWGNTGAKSSSRLQAEGAGAEYDEGGHCGLSK